MDVVKFEKKDWEELRDALIVSIKNNIAQKEFYDIQWKVVNEQLAKFPDEKIKDKKVIGVE